MFRLCYHPGITLAPSFFSACPLIFNMFARPSRDLQGIFDVPRSPVIGLYSLLRASVIASMQWDSSVQAALRNMEKTLLGPPIFNIGGLSQITCSKCLFGIVSLLSGISNDAQRVISSHISWNSPAHLCGSGHRLCPTYGRHIMSISYAHYMGV